MSSTTESYLSTTTRTLGTSATDSWIGYTACLISCIAFGTMFVPMRKLDCKDGIFVQWIQCCVVFLFGFSINIVRWFPKFEPIAGIGGLLFATGNVFSIPLIRGLGIGPGMLIWGTCQVIVGWSVARFGLFSVLDPSPVEHNGLNYIGMIIVLVCGVLFVFVKHSEPDSESEDSIELKESAQQDAFEKMMKGNWMMFVSKLPFVGMAMCLGVLHGLMMCPIAILEQREPSEDQYRVFDFVFSYFSSVFFFSTIYFLVYCLVMREKAHIKKELILPSVLYGVLWNIGMTLWFLSSDKLEQTVAFPITTRLPSTIGALLDVFVFKTIRGRSNIAYLAFVITLGIIGVTLIALSNQKF